MFGSATCCNRVKNDARVDLPSSPAIVGSLLAAAAADALAVPASQSVDPGAVATRFAVSGSLRSWRRARAPASPAIPVTAPVVDQFAGIVGEADEAGFGKYCGGAVAELIVELAADQHDEIGIGHRGRPHRADDRGMIGRHEPAALLRVEIECAALRRGSAPAPLGAACAPRPVIDHGRLARPEYSTAFAMASGSGGRRAAALVASIHRARVAEARRTQHVGWDFDIDRAGLARVAHRAGNGFVEFAHDLLGARAAVRDVRVTGRRMSTCGMSCSGPILACGREVQPPISITGARASEAFAIAVTVLVTPGPAVTIATPNCRR